MFGSKKLTAEELKEAAALKVREDLAQKNGNLPSGELTKRERMALEIAKTVNFDEYDTYQGWAEAVRNATDSLLTELQD